MQYGEPSSHAAAGQAVRGFALSIRSDAATFRLGGPISVTVELRNVSRRLQHAMFGSLHSTYDFRIKDERTGAIVPANPSNRFGAFAGSVSTIGPGVSPGRSFYGDARLDLLYSFTEPGTYYVTATRGHGRGALESNQIRITVLR